MEKLKLQVIKFGSNCIFDSDNKEKLNHKQLRKNWAEQIKQYEEMTGIKTYLRASGAIALEKKRLKDKRENSQISDAELSSLAGRGQRLLMNFYADVFDRLYTVSQALFTTKKESNQEAGIYFAETVFFELQNGLIPITNYNDRISKKENRRDNDCPGAEDAVLFNWFPDVEVVRYMMVSTENGLYRLHNDPSTIIKDVYDITDTLYSICGNKSYNGSGGMKSKIDAAKLTTEAGIPTLICNVRKGLIENLERRVDNTLFYPK